MASRSDHDRRDAEDAARKEVQLLLGKYARRWLDTAYTAIDAALAKALAEGLAVDGTVIGRDAALNAVALDVAQSDAIEGPLAVGA